MPEALAFRSPPRRSRAGAGHGSSCDLLIGLAGHELVRAVLTEVGVDVDALPAIRDRLADEIESEPADWHLRLQQRGGRVGPEGELEQLLAIVRSADCHAYQALQLAGANTGQLRRLLIERVRERGRQRVSRRPEPAARPGKSASSSGSLRMSAIREGSSARPAPPSPRQSLRGGGHSSAASPSATAQPHARPQPVRAAGTRPTQAAQPARSHAASPAPSPEPRALPARARDEHKAEPEPDELRSLHPAKLPPMAGRQRELAMLADALLRRSPRAPLLVGEHGSGRTLLATHLATILDRPIFRLEAPRYADEGEPLADDLELIAEAGGVVIFDELDRVAAEAPPCFLPALARAWASGTPRILTVLSHETRARLETWMPGILETLDVVLLPPLDTAEVHQAVKLASPAILEQHGLSLDPRAHLSELTRIADRFLSGLAMPGRALDLLDLACARAVRSGHQVLDPELWIDIVCERTGLPRNRVEGRNEREILDLDVQLARQVVGHEHVLEALAALIRRNRAGFSSGRPIASVLLLGPSGVGKTEIAKALASALYERDDALLRLDMSEYAEAHAVARVVGAPPGYVGHEQGGALTDPMIQNPHRVVLLDEIEKSHRDVHQLLLQVFDEGRLTDGRGRTIDFRHAVVIMTSNLGAELMMHRPEHGEHGEQPEDETVLERARAHFPVELWNRIEAPLVLRPLHREQMLAICRRLITSSSARLAHERGIRYRVDDEVIEQLIERAGVDPALGARPLRHLLGREIESMVAEAILRGQVRAGDEIEVRRDEDGRLLCARAPRVAKGDAPGGAQN
ncbi:AAA family ATPase [Pseudenhygromyxa sp. WMMC2535]|uniref:AAA family ATPase n=1 Tax=Pseudenhygromyxa sp. WMMC2535 TaxID=2712867 RepID=UPI001553DDAF|nr:AAA family ATPase [Pseudenhygromyxa sp. WMMC2535]NVB42016.1 AAA family ATPase [Pseudenhygromyxa sp. WMMC2535]